MIKPFIFWDWNGTLLDDVDVCVDSMNAMLDKRGMPLINKNQYKEVFNFPVIKYYLELGFNFSKCSFEDLSVEFINEYNSRIHRATLYNSVKEVLIELKAKGVKHIIVSAMEQQMLESQLKEHGVRDYFTNVLGLNNIYADSKSHLAINYMIKHKINSNEILFIGDSLHDAEVADEIGSELILISNGHHSHSRLSVNGRKVIKSLGDLTLLIN